MNDSFLGDKIGPKKLITTRVYTVPLVSLVLTQEDYILLNLITIWLSILFWPMPIEANISRVTITMEFLFIHQ